MLRVLVIYLWRTFKDGKQQLMTLSGLARLRVGRRVLGLWIRQKVVDGCIETQ